MSKKPIVGGVILVAILGMIAVGAKINPESPENESLESVVWHTRIVGPEFDNISNHRMDLGSLEGGTYKIGFVPMGDSPKNLRIKVVGFGIMFAEKFILERSLVDTGISKYYTWEYIGKENVLISNQQCPNQKTCNYDITVERVGNLEGSVSISLSKISI